MGEPCHFHDLRHTHAALLIAEGIREKPLQARLGHMSIKTTLDTYGYGHLFDDSHDAAADALNRVWNESPAGYTRVAKCRYSPLTSAH